ncbi:MAG: hypothetical protein ACYTF3_09280 [Planctomycetota bacterium]|jgi:hypothetical protein
MRFTLCTLVLAVCGLAAPQADAQIVNGSFETGDFTGWTVTDLPSPFWPMSVATAGFSPWGGFFLTTPTDGIFVMENGFDGDGPGVIRMTQDAFIDQPQLAMDIRAAADLFSFGATLPRTFSVVIEPAGGGAALQTDLLYTAPVGIITNDSGNLPVTVDMSSFLGSTVRIALEWNIPENFSGPGHFQVDNIRLESGPGPRLALNGPCPGPSTVVLDFATPFAPVAFAYGAPGSFTIGSGSCAGTTIAIGSPTLAGIFGADAAGSLSLAVTLPPALCGLTLQAVDLTACTVSNTVIF